MQKNHAQFRLQTDKFRTFRVMDHNFGTLRRVSWQQRELKPIDHLPRINLWCPTRSPHALALVCEQWSIHVSVGKCRSQAALSRCPRVTSYRYLCLYFILKKNSCTKLLKSLHIGKHMAYYIKKKTTLDSGSKRISFVHSGWWTTILVHYDMFHGNEESRNLSITSQWSIYDDLH
jgi:hypothetical protein